MRRLALILCVMTCAGTALAQLRVSNIPTGAAVVITQSSAVAVTWSVAGTTPGTTVVSEEGLFVLNGETLGRVNTFLTTAATTDGTAVVTETLLIPPDVTNRAYQRKAGTFFYQRQFRSTSDGAAGESSLTCRVSTSAYGNFSIAGVTLYFENERGEVTFEQNDPHAHAFAEIHYNGSGLLKGTWEVQEPNNPQFRVLQQVNYHLAYGDRIVFQSPQVPPLPTVVTGRHILRFNITQPVSGFPLPVVSYFVKVKPADEKATPKLISESPLANTIIGTDTIFHWRGSIGGATLLKFSVSERSSLGDIPEVSPSVESLPQSNPLAGSRILQPAELVFLKGVEVFSAALPAGADHYAIKGEQLQRLRAGKTYLWQVQALDSTGKILSETDPLPFQFPGKPKS